MVVHFALSAYLLSIFVSSALSAKCSTNMDCVTTSPCTVDFCEPLFRICVSAGPATCPEAQFVETSRSALLRAAEKKPLNLTERLAIIMRAQQTFRDIHPHRQLHLNFLKVDPVAKLRSFAREVRKSGGRGPVVAFHDRMIDIFQEVDDRHTLYIVPPPLGNGIAFLPFQVREYYNSSMAGDFSVPFPNYIVSDVAAKARFSNSAFEKGVQIVSWNGVSIREAVMTEGREGYGSTRHAKHRLGLKSLTFKWLFSAEFPRQDDAEIGFITAGGRISSVSIPWTFASIHESSNQAALESSIGKQSIYPDYFYRLRSDNKDKGGGVGRTSSSYMRKAERKRFREIPVNANVSDSFEARVIQTQRGAFGSIIVHNFSPLDDEKFLSEMRRVVLLMPRTGLVFDLRGNDGGSVSLCQNIVQLFTKKRVMVTSSTVRTTPLTLELARVPLSLPIQSRFARGVFGAATRQAETAEKFGDQYFGSFRILEDEANNYKGERYDAPVVVLVDAETYSCGDIFAAVVQDSGAGLLVGVDQSTGGGGSAILSTTTLELLYPSVFDSLPGNVAWQFSIFRVTRGGKNEGMPFEYFGIELEERYYYTRADRLNADRDLHLYLNDQLARLRNGTSAKEAEVPSVS